LLGNEGEREKKEEEEEEEEEQSLEIKSKLLSKQCVCDPLYLAE
jgi:hypothetical protein